MCFALARLAKFVVFAALYLLAVMAAGTIYSGLSSHMFYAGPVCFVLFMSLFLLKTTMLRACKRFILRKRIQLTSFEIVCFAATCVVMCAQIGFAWWHVSAKDAWVIAVCWGLFFMGALGTSSDASEQFEHILPPAVRAAPTLKTVVMLEGIRNLNRLASRISRECSAPHFATDHEDQFSTYFGAHSIGKHCRVHAGNAGALNHARIEPRYGTTTIVDKSFVNDYASTAWQYVREHLTDTDWAAYQACFGENIVEMIRLYRG